MPSNVVPSTLHLKALMNFKEATPCRRNARLTRRLRLSCKSLHLDSGEYPLYAHAPIRRVEF